MSSLEFSAVTNFNNDGSSDKLVVQGSVMVYTDATEVNIKKADVQGVNPAILLLQLEITPKPGPMKGMPRSFVYEAAGSEVRDYTHVQIVTNRGESRTSEIDRVQKLLYINEIDIAILKSNPPQLSIVAYGSAPTTNWSNIRLLPKGINPEDGYFELDLVGAPPIGAAGEMITPVVANYIWQDYSTESSGVRIAAALNSMEVQLAGSETREVALSE